MKRDSMKEKPMRDTNQERLYTQIQDDDATHIWETDHYTDGTETPSDTPAPPKGDTNEQP